MEKHPVPDSLSEMIENAVRDVLKKAISESFAAGYLKGADDVTQRVVAAARGDASATVKAKGQSVAIQVHDAVSASSADHVEHPNSANARRFPYGAISNAFRDALRAQQFFGVSKDDLVSSASKILGHDINSMDHRDTFKRLKKAGDLKVENGRYFAGPNLASNENGAQATMPLGAPEAGEATTSPNHSQAVYDQIGSNLA